MSAKTHRVYSPRGKGARCAYCERRLEAPTSPSKLAATRDHVVPRSAGGTEKVWCCRQCNSLKGDMMPDQWLAFRQSNPEWWRRPEYQVGVSNAGVNARTWLQRRIDKAARRAAAKAMRADEPHP